MATTPSSGETVAQLGFPNISSPSWPVVKTTAPGNAFIFWRPSQGSLATRQKIIRWMTNCGENHGSWCLLWGMGIRLPSEGQNEEFHFKWKKVRSFYIVLLNLHKKFKPFKRTNLLIIYEIPNRIHSLSSQIFFSLNSWIKRRGLKLGQVTYPFLQAWQDFLSMYNVLFIHGAPMCSPI